jgi:hypothetical protein
LHSIPQTLHFLRSASSSALAFLAFTAHAPFHPTAHASAHLTSAALVS